MEKKITAKAIHKFAVHLPPERPDLAVLEIQVSGETAHYSVPRTNLRRMAEGLMKEVEQMETSAPKPN